MNSDMATIVYSYFFVAGGVGTIVWMMFKHGVHKAIEEHMTEIRSELACVAEMDKRTSRIEYALYNDGKTGLINKVDALIKNQQYIKTEIEVIKVKVDHR